MPEAGGLPSAIAVVDARQDPKAFRFFGGGRSAGAPFTTHAGQSTGARAPLNRFHMADHRAAAAQLRPFTQSEKIVAMQRQLVRLGKKPERIFRHANKERRDENAEHKQDNNQDLNIETASSHRSTPESPHV